MALGRRIPPPNYSLLPPGVAAPPQLMMATSVDRPARNPLAELPVDSQSIDDVRFEEEAADPSSALDDDAFWRVFSDSDTPLFGYENATRLSKGDAPERYNPVIGRVEKLERDRDAATITWPQEAEHVLLIGRNE